MDGDACQLGDKGLDHAANFRVVWRHAGQWATITADDEAAIVLLKFGQATQLVEYLNRRLEPRAIRPCGMLFG